jgi:hypothetical protein
MADVYAVFGTLLALGVAFPGMLAAWWLIFPGMIERASLRLEHSPWKSLGMGMLLAFPLIVVIVILIASPFGVVKFAGATMLVGGLAFASLGASGLAWMMARRLAGHQSQALSPLAGFLRGALALELAAAFPVIGWLLVIPAVILAGYGAATFALLGWMPAKIAEERSAPTMAVEREPTEEPVLGQASA